MRQFHGSSRDVSSFANNTLRRPLPLILSASPRRTLPKFLIRRDGLPHWVPECGRQTRHFSFRPIHASCALDILTGCQVRVWLLKDIIHQELGEHIPLPSG